MRRATPSQVDILIVTALHEELRALEDLFDLSGSPVLITASIPCFFNPEISCTSGDEFYSAAVFCLNSMGNASASTYVSHAVRDLNPSYVFMFGIAGGFKDQVGLADVIIPDKIFYTALGKQYPDRRDVRPETLKIDPFLLQRLHVYAFQQQNGKDYEVKIGALAVGEEVVASSGGVAELLRIHPKMLGVEMESYGVGLAVATYDTTTKFVAVRGVSDHADEHKSDNYRGKALKNAAEFLIGFIKSGLLPKRRSDASPLPKFVAINHLSLFRRPSVTQASHSYLKRLQDFDLIELPIDQVDLYKGGSLTNPREALQRQQEIFARLEEILQKYPESKLGYFGLAHVPLMFHLGFKVNRREIQVFGNNYVTGEWVDLPPQSSVPKIIIDGLPEQRVQDAGDVLVLMSISHSITSVEPDQISENAIARIHLRVEEPFEGIVDSIEVLDTLTNRFRDVRRAIQTNLPFAERIHLFYAGPPTLAFRCGQQINPNIDREYLVYNYSRSDHPNYRWALNLQTEEIIERK